MSTPLGTALHPLRTEGPGAVTDEAPPQWGRALQRPAQPPEETKDPEVQTARLSMASSLGQWVAKAAVPAAPPKTKGTALRLPGLPAPAWRSVPSSAHSPSVALEPVSGELAAACGGTAHPSDPQHLGITRVQGESAPPPPPGEGPQGQERR